MRHFTPPSVTVTTLKHAFQGDSGHLGGYLNLKDSTILPNRNMYALLSPTYVSILGFSTYCYVHAKPMRGVTADTDSSSSSSSHVAECTVLSATGVLLKQYGTLHIPLDVILAHRVEKGETMSGIGQRQLTFGMVQDTTNGLVWHYGQIIDTSWQKNFIYEAYDTHARCRLLLCHDSSIHVVKPNAVIPVSVINFLLHPFEAMTVDKAGSLASMQKTHDSMDAAVSHPSQGLELLVSTYCHLNGKQASDIPWQQQQRITTSVGQEAFVKEKEAVDEVDEEEGGQRLIQEQCLEEAIQLERLRQELELWSGSLKTNAQRIEDAIIDQRVKNRTLSS